SPRPIASVWVAWKLRLARSEPAPGLENDSALPPTRSTNSLPTANRPRETPRRDHEEAERRGQERPGELRARSAVPPREPVRQDEIEAQQDAEVLGRRGDPRRQPAGRGARADRRAAPRPHA